MKLIKRRKYWILLKDGKILIATRCRKTAVDYGVDLG